MTAHVHPLPNLKPSRWEAILWRKPPAASMWE